MPVDYHNHTPLCGHAAGSMEEYVERARALGLVEYGFSEHSPWMIQHPGQWLAMTAEDLPRYVEAVRHLQARYEREGSHPFHVRLGIEMDFVPSRLAIAEKVSSDYDWDYRIGSIHHIGLWGFDDPDRREDWGQHHPEDVFESYFELLRRLIEARFCEILGHLDLPKKFGHRPPGGILRWVEPLVPLIREAGMAVEINTAGRDKPVGEFYPSWDIVERLIEAGIPITLGADAHRPEEVGRYLPEATAGLRDRGRTWVARFEKRRMIPIEI